jgi:hypothetical protein
MTCPCVTAPFESPCCRWPGNQSLCVCAEAGLGEPAPS